MAIASPPAPPPEDDAPDPSPRDLGPPRYSRRLSDKVLIAFHHACDQGDLDIAEQLLHVLENVVNRSAGAPDTNRRSGMNGLVAAHERLWLLRHPEAQ